MPERERERERERAGRLRLQAPSQGRLGTASRIPFSSPHERERERGSEGAGSPETVATVTKSFN